MPTGMATRPKGRTPRVMKFYGLQFLGEDVQFRHIMTDPGREVVKRRLESFGFKVDIIREDPKDNRPDLRSKKDGITMFVEVKTRVEDAQLRRKMESVAP